MNIGDYIFKLYLSILFCSHLPRLPDLLESDDVNLRIVSGEAIAMFYELAREDDDVSILKIIIPPEFVLLMQVTE